MCLDFYGSSGRLYIGSDSGIDNIWDGGGTAMAWIRPFGYGENGRGRILAKASSTYPNDGWGIYLRDGPDNSLSLAQDFSTNTGAWDTNNNTILLQIWYHIAITYNSDSAINNPNIYLNGDSVTVNEYDTPSGTRTTDAAQNLYIGNHFADNRTFNGQIADVRLYDRILSSVEIKTIYLYRGSDFIFDNMLSGWRLNERTSGTVASGTGSIRDIKNNKRDGTPYGGSVYYAVDPLTYTQRGRKWDM